MKWTYSQKRACLVNREKMVQQDFCENFVWAGCSVYPNTNVLWKLVPRICDRRKLGEHATKFEKSSRNEFQKNENYLCIKPGLDA